MATGTPVLQFPPSQTPGAQGDGLQQEASPALRLLANWHRVASEIGEVFPQIAAMMAKVADATREALVVLAREHQTGQPQGLPPQDVAAVPTPQQSPTY
jgi:hypothetical protein